jgi:hypothetical protein
MYLKGRAAGSDGSVETACEDFFRETPARLDKTRQTHHKRDKYLNLLLFHQVSLQRSGRIRQVTWVSMVSLVSLFHSGLRPALNINAGY